MKYVTIRRSEWGRNYLLSEFRGKKMCCLGFCAARLGADEESMRFRELPGDIDLDVEFEEEFGLDNWTCVKLAKVNDSYSKNRESKLNKILSEVGAKVRFKFVD